MTPNELQKLSETSNGYTNKEMLYIIKEDVTKLHERIDFLHEKINKAPTRQEVVGWLVAITSAAAFLNSIM